MIEGACREIMDSIGEGIVLINRDYKITFANKGIMNIYGTQDMDIIGKECHSVFHQSNVVCSAGEKTSSTFICPHYEVFNTGRTATITHTHHLPDGSQRVLDITASPLKDETGNVVQVIESIKDVTEKHAIEKTLLEKQLFIQRVAETAPTIIAIYDITENQLVFANNQLKVILGYSHAELQQMGSKIYEILLHPDDLALLPERMNKYENAGNDEIIETDYRIKHTSGEWRWFHNRDVVFTRTGEGKAKQVLITAQDVTRHKHAEEALKVSEKKYRSLVNNALVGVYQTNMEGEILYVNDALVRMFDFTSPEEVMSEGVIKRYRNPDDRERFIKSLEQGGAVDSFEVELTTKTGDIKKVLLNAVVDGSIISGMIMDITERSDLESALKRRVKELEEFYDMAVGRELRMKELKDEIEKLKGELKKYES